MHQQFAKDGLVALSLTVDDPEDAEAKERALKFLKKQNATFGNYLMDEPAETWQTKLDVSAPPAVLVYGRDGKLVKRFKSDEEFTYKDVRKVVEPLLQEQK
jgi:hypothetical protein